MALGFIGAKEIFFGANRVGTGKEGAASVDRDLLGHDARKEMRESLSSGPQTSSAGERGVALACGPEISVRGKEEDVGLAGPRLLGRLHA